MIIIATGLQTGQLPAPGSQAYNGLVHRIIFAPNAQAATGYVSIKQGTNTIYKFNVGAPNGSNDDEFCIKSPGDGNMLDPTQFTVAQTVAGEGLFVTYIVT